MDEKEISFRLVRHADRNIFEKIKVVDGVVLFLQVLSGRDFFARIIF